MELFRREIDKSILDELKDKIYIYLQGKNLDANFFKSNMDAVTGLYVENSKERGGSIMQSRSATATRPAEIMLDKQFIEFDSNNNPIQIDRNMQKLIKSQLGHELIHSAARYDGFTGILSVSNNRGLNEGITQMLTEKIFGYTVSSNTDSYKDYKAIAQILDITFGEDVILNSYFNHTNTLEQKCNLLSNDSNFYKDLNKVINVMYTIKSNKLEKDSYYANMSIPIYDELRKSLLQKICTDIVIPTLRTLSKEQQTDYINKILESVKDNQEFSNQLSITIKNISSKATTKKQLSDVQKRKEFIDKVYSGVDCNSIVTINQNGKIFTKDNEEITDKYLQEKILSQLYFQENNYSKERRDNFANNVHKICENLEQDNIFEFGNNEKDALARKKLFSAIKVSARNKGYIILNTLEECDSEEAISLNAIQIPNYKNPVSFQQLQSIYENYTIDYDSEMQMFAKSRDSESRIDDIHISRLAKFANMWAAAAGSKWTEEEKIKGETYAFNESSEKVFNKLSELVNRSLNERGTIDTQEIYNEIANGDYKYSEEIINALFKRPESIKIINDFYRMQNPKARLETELAKTSSEFVMEIDGKEYRENEAKGIVETIEIEGINKKCIDEGLRSSEIAQMYKNIQTQIQTNEKEIGGNR